MVRRRGSRSIGSNSPRARAAAASAGPPRPLDVAVRLLARAPRSIAEIATQLGRRRFAREAIDATIAALRERGYLDDAALAHRRAEDLLLRRGHGRLRVAYELTRRGVAASVIEDALATVMEGRRDAEFARLALCRKFGHDSRDRLKDASARARAYRYLIGRGHPPEAVIEVLGDDDSR